MTVRKTMPATSRRLCSRLLSWWTLISILAPLSRDPDGGRGAPDREAEEEVGHDDRHDARPDCPADRHAHSRGAAGRRVAVVAVDQDHGRGQEQQLAEGPQHVDRWQELQEVVVVRPG